MDVKMEASWKELLKDEFDKPYFAQLVEFLHHEKQSGKTIYPPGGSIFKAFEMTPLSNLKVVLLGQDPYHGKGQAHGLSFSVPQGITPPPSLINIFKELNTDLGYPIPHSGSLERWAEQGVLLLNAILTVEEGKAASHSKIGWSEFTDAVIRNISEKMNGIVFLLWGNFARSKKLLIDQTRHFILEAAHPSPLARGAFFGSKPFSQTNKILESLGKEPINWNLE